MAIQDISWILNAHHISHKLTEDGHLLAEEVWTENGIGFSQWIDVTGYSVKRLLDWLGY